MKTQNISREIHSINNLIKRRKFESKELQQVDKITKTNAQIMSYLGRNQDKEIYQRDIEEELTIARSTVSRVLKLMEEKQLIERHSSTEDTRLKIITLTKDALSMHQSITSHIADVESQMMADFTDEDIDLLHTLLGRMKKNLVSQ